MLTSGSLHGIALVCSAKFSVGRMALEAEPGAFPLDQARGVGRMRQVTSGTVALGERYVLDGPLQPLNDALVTAAAQLLEGLDEQSVVGTAVGVVTAEALALRHGLVNHGAIQILPQVVVT